MTARRISRTFPRLLGATVVLLFISGICAWSEEADGTTSASRTSAEAVTSASRTPGTDATSSASRVAGTPKDITAALYDIAQGPALRLCLLIAALGILYRTWQFRRLTRTLRGRHSSPVVRGTPGHMHRVSGQGVISHPVMRTVSMGFHILLFLVPLLLPAHNMILHRSLHASLPTIPSPAADWLTMVLIAIGGFFLARRLFFPRVRILSTAYDYAILLLVLAPFITGLMAYHHVSSSRWLMIAHVVSADILFLAIPFTKLGHMPFLLFSRFFVSGEYTWKPGKRAWGSSR